MVYYSKILVGPTGLELFWDDFPNKHKIRVRPGPTHTSIVNSDFLKKNYLQSPLAGNLIPCTSYLVFTTQATGGCEV